MDPEQALSARELTEGLRIVTDHMAGQDGTGAAVRPAT